MRLTKISGSLGDVVSEAIYGKKAEASAKEFSRLLKEASIERLSVSQFSRLVLATFSVMARALTPGEQTQIFQRLKENLEALAQRYKGAEMTLAQAEMEYNKIVREPRKQGVEVPDAKDSRVQSSINEILEQIKLNPEQFPKTKVVTPKSMEQDWQALLEQQNNPIGQVKPVAAPPRAPARQRPPAAMPR